MQNLDMYYYNLVAKPFCFICLLWENLVYLKHGKLDSFLDIGKYVFSNDISYRTKIKRVIRV